MSIASSRSQVTHNVRPTWLRIKGSHDPVLGFNYLNLGKTLTGLLQDMIKDTGEQPGEETYKAKSRTVPSIVASVLVKLGCLIL